MQIPHDARLKLRRVAILVETIGASLVAQTELSQTGTGLGACPSPVLRPVRRFFVLSRLCVV